MRNLIKKILKEEQEWFEEIKPMSVYLPWVEDGVKGLEEWEGEAYQSDDEIGEVISNLKLNPTKENVKYTIDTIQRWKGRTYEEGDDFDWALDFLKMSIDPYSWKRFNIFGGNTQFPWGDLKESFEDDFEWVNDIPKTNIEVLGSSELGDYVNDYIRLTPIINIIYNKGGMDYADALFREIGGYLIEHGVYDYENPTDDIFRHAFFMYFMGGIDRNVLRKSFGKPMEHDFFGEGDDDGEHSFNSYMLRIKGKYVHIGYDNRGTSIEVERDTTPDELHDILKIIAEETVIHFQ